MSPQPNLSSILKNLEAARPVWDFDTLLAGVATLSSASAGAALREMAPVVRKRLLDAPKACDRFIFKGSEACDEMFGEYPRIDVVVRQLVTIPAAQQKITATLDALPTLSAVLHLQNEVLGSPFTCPAEVRHRLRVRAPDLTLAGAKASAGLATLVQVATEQATNLIVEWWLVRLDCLSLAVAELLNALQTDTVYAVVIAPDGTRQEIPAPFWKTPDGWSIIVEGLAYIDTKQTFASGARTAACGVYIEAVDPVALIRKGKVSSKTEVEARRWLIREIKKSPNKAPMTRAKYKQELIKKWGLGSNGFDRVWHYALDHAGDHNWRKGGRPKKAET